VRRGSFGWGRRRPPGHGGTQHGGSTNGSACKCGRMHLGALTTQASPRRARQSALVAVLPIVTCDVAAPPHRIPPCPSTRTHSRKGDSPLFRRVKRQCGTHATPPRVDFYTGERLAMGSTAIGSAPSRVSRYGAVATGLPIASTSVASRSPVIELIFVLCSAVPRDARDVVTRAPCTASDPARTSKRCGAARAARNTSPRCSSGRSGRPRLSLRRSRAWFRARGGRR